jgi:hypothetical protein
MARRAAFLLERNHLSRKIFSSYDRPPPSFEKQDAIGTMR